MKPVTKYESDDGKIFDTEAEALERDEFAKAIASIKSLLLPTPKNRNFSLGSEYLQQNEESVKLYKKQVLTLAVEKELHSRMKEWLSKSDTIDGNHIVGRVLCDSSSELYKLWYRIMCIDSKYREWYQPYYAKN